MTDARPKRHMLIFLRTEDGAVTVDWVVLAAAVVLFSVPILNTFFTAVEDGATAVAEKIDTN